LLLPDLRTRSACFIFLHHEFRRYGRIIRSLELIIKARRGMNNQRMLVNDLFALVLNWSDW